MRLLKIVLTVLLFLAILGFVGTNLDAAVDLTILSTIYQQIPLYAIVIIALAVGVLFSGIIFVAEGTNTRLENIRLTKKIRKLETEVHYLRTQPPAAPRREPDDLPAEDTSRKSPGSDDRKAGAPASAPIYGSTQEGWDGDDDDDFYSGGRAV